MKKYLLSLLIVLLVVTSLVGTAAEPQIVRVAAQSWQINKIFIDRAAENFMKDHPGVKVDVQMYAEPTVISNYAINWMRGETPIDIAVVSGAQFASQFVGRNLIYDFNELGFFNDPNFSRDRFVKVALDDGMINGKQYVIPLINEVYGVNINMKMFREAGLVDSNGKPLAP